jgi:hypothetical protein
MLGRRTEALRRLRRSIELDEDRPLATHDPGIVTRLEHDDLRGDELEGAAVAVLAPPLHATHTRLSSTPPSSSPQRRCSWRKASRSSRSGPHGSSE